MSCITFQNDELTHDGHIKQVNSVNLEGGETGYLPRQLKHHAAKCDNSTIPEERNILQWVFYLKIKESYFDMCISIFFLRVYIVSLSFISRETLSSSIFQLKSGISPKC